MRTVKVWPLGQGKGTRMGCRDVNRTIRAGREEVPLELRGWGRQTMDNGDWRKEVHTTMSRLPSVWP